MSEPRRFECPDEICILFEDDPEEGRRQAVEWVASLNTEDGDLVWLPEMGWQVKGPAIN